MKIRNDFVTEGGSGVFILSKASGTINVTNTIIQDSTAIGGATWNALRTNGNINGGNNTGWHFGEVDMYWVGDGGDWTDIAHWSYTSGGLPCGSIPDEETNCIFDENSFTMDSQNVRTSGTDVIIIKSLNFTDVTHNPTFPDDCTFAVHDDVTLSENMSFDYTLSILTYGESSRLKSAGNTLNALYVSGTLSLQDNLSCGGISIGRSCVITGGSLSELFDILDKGELRTNNYSIISSMIMIGPDSTILFGSSHVQVYLIFIGPTSLPMNFKTSTIEFIPGEFDPGAGLLPFDLEIPRIMTFFDEHTQTILTGENWNIILEEGTIDLTCCTISNCNASGGAIFEAQITEGNIDGGGNTGWNFGESVLQKQVLIYNYDSHIGSIVNDEAQNIELDLNSFSDTSFNDSQSKFGTTSLQMDDSSLVVLPLIPLPNKSNFTCHGYYYFGGVPESFVYPGMVTPLRTGWDLFGIAGTLTSMFFSQLFQMNIPSLITFVRSNMAGYWLNIDCSHDGNNIILAGEELCISNDGGTSWFTAKPGGAGDSVVMFCASDYDGSNLIVSNQRLYTSSDFGANWTERQPAGDVIKTWTVIDSNSDGSVLLAGSFLGRLYISSDSGVTWTETRPGGNLDLNWSSGKVSSDGNFLIAVANGGTSPPFALELVSFIIAMMGMPSSYYQYLPIGTSSHVYISTDRGLSWNEIIQDGYDQTGWYLSCMDSDGSNIILANLYLDGSNIYTDIWVSSDFGQSWDMTYTMSGIATSITCGGDGGIVVIFSGGEAYYSLNSGVDFTNVGMGLTFYGLVVSEDSSTAYFSGLPGGIYKSMVASFFSVQPQLLYPRGNTEELQLTTLVLDISPLLKELFLGDLLINLIGGGYPSPETFLNSCCLIINKLVSDCELKMTVLRNLQVDDWNHVAFTCDAGRLSIFSNGRKTDCGTLKNPYALKHYISSSFFEKSNDPDNLFLTDAVEITNEILWDKDFIPPNKPPVLGVKTLEGMFRSYSSIFLRFQDVNIPQGINLADETVMLRITNKGMWIKNDHEEILVDVFVEDTNNVTAAPIDEDEFEALVLSEPISWTLPYSLKKGANIDVTPLVQEIIRKDDWVPGNSMMFVLKSNSTGVYFLNVYDYTDNVGKISKLIVYNLDEWGNDPGDNIFLPL